MRTVSLPRIVALAIGASALSTSASAAVDSPVTLSWSAPERADCPAADYMVGEIERYLGARRGGQGKPIQATATVRGVGHGRWLLRLETREGDVEGERVFRDQSCWAVADAAVVVLAWMVDPNAMAHRSSLAPEDSTPPRAVPRKPKPALKREPGGVPNSVAPFFAIGSEGDWGTLPWPALGVEAEVSIAWPRFRFAARASYWPSRRKTAATVSDGSSAGARFSLGALSLEGCFDALSKAPARPLQLSLCVGPELDRVHGAGFGVSEPADGSKAWLALRGGVEAEWVLHGPWSLGLGARAIVPTEREHFALQGVGEIYRPAVIAVRVGLSLGLEL